MQELAEQEEDSETVSSLTLKLSELEEKAEQLDKQRSKGLSAIRSVGISQPQSLASALITVNVEQTC